MPSTPARSGLSILVLALGLAFAPAVMGAARAAPSDWTLKDIDGREIQLSKVAGQKTHVLFFWATWCPYCKALMPHLQSLVDEYGRKNLEILAINIKEDGDPAAFLARHGYQFRLVPAGDKVAAQYDITATPGVLVLDRQGAVFFDLRDATSPREREIHKNMSDSEKAGRRAPFWAARIRRALDELAARLSHNPREPGVQEVPAKAPASN